MKNLIFLSIMVVMLLTGCATAKSVDKNYSLINYKDGISITEAKLIAKKSLLESKSLGAYQFMAPKVFDRWESYRHQNYWFVLFSPKAYQLKPSHYLVVVEKKSGKIQYAETKYPSNVKGYDWLFGLEPEQYSWHKN